MAVSKGKLRFAIELAEIEKLLRLSRIDYVRASREWTRFKSEKGILVES